MNHPSIYWQGEGEHLLTHEEFPRASRYDPSWVLENQMGPNALWLTERLCNSLDLKPGMRVLDLGCGRGLSSVFLAKEYRVNVWATDLWIKATDNLRQFTAAQVDDRVYPLHAEAHALPYAHEFFDCIISIDAYQYFGTDLMYLGYLAQFMKPQGQIGIIVPGLHRPLRQPLPKHLTTPQAHGSVFWAWDMCTFQTAGWWKNLWSQYPFFTVEHARAMPDGGAIWLAWEQAIEKTEIKTPFPSDQETLAADANQHLTFIEVIGRRTADCWS